MHMRAEPDHVKHAAADLACSLVSFWKANVPP